MKAHHWLFGIGGLALITSGFARLEGKMADNTQSILDAIDASKQKVTGVDPGAGG